MAIPFINEKNIDLLAVNQRQLAAGLQPIVDRFHDTNDQPLKAFLSGGVKGLAKKLCPLASTLTCANNLLKYNVFQIYSLTPAKLLETIITHHGRSDFVPFSEDESALEEWKKINSLPAWSAFTEKGDLRYQAVCSLAEGLGIRTLAVENLPLEKLNGFLIAGGNAALSIDNRFILDFSRIKSRGMLSPSGHLVAVLGISNDPCQSLLEKSLFLYDPYSEVNQQKLSKIKIEELLKYLPEKGSVAIARGLLLTTSGRILSELFPFKSPTAVRSQTLIEQVKASRCHDILLKRFFFLAHLAFIFLLFASPFLVNWKILLTIFVIYFVYRDPLELKGKDYVCPFTQWESKGRRSFLKYYFQKIGVSLTDFHLKYIIGYLLPIIIIFAAIIVQSVPI